MPSHPVFFAGGAIVAFAFVAFATILFSHGGFNRARQLGVILKLLRGEHGNGTRLGFVASVLGLILGACLLFSGVAAQDRARAEACAERCRALGYPSHRMGPNTNRIETDRTTWYLACICEGPDREPTELRADRLLDR